jgi:TolB-like protein/Tfp pilus assembly protein PilF
MDCLRAGGRDRQLRVETGTTGQSVSRRRKAEVQLGEVSAGKRSFPTRRFGQIASSRKKRRVTGRKLLPRSPRRILSARTNIARGQRMSEEAPESGGGQPPTDPPAVAHVPNASIHVFISYASQDVAVADAIVEALERHGFRCWIAPRDVVPGESYAGAIVHAIDATKLIVLVLSENAATSQHVLREVERASSRRHPVVAFRIDLAPMPVDLEYFLNTSQWLDASAFGVERALPKLVDAVQRILASTTPAQSHQSDETSKTVVELSAARRGGAQANRRLNRVLIALGAMIGLALGYFVVDRVWLSQRAAPPKPVIATAPVTPSFNPPAHSIAVLPFVNMSGDKEQEYFSDGLTEEILNSLARINELQVSARTSSFSFRGKDADLGTIAHKLNVASILEGSVRRAGNTVRITAQLNDAVTGFHLWSQTYDRDLSGVLKLQTDVANAVANALKVTLLGDVAAKIELGGTRDPAALDAYLRGRKAYIDEHEVKDFQTAIGNYSEAIGRDPNYALAFAGRSLALIAYAGEAPESAVREGYEKAQQDALKALAVAPDLGEGHLALADYFKNGALDFTRANEEYKRAVALAPGNAQALLLYGLFTVEMGRKEAGIAAARRAVVLDPLNHYTRFYLAYALHWAHEYDQAIAAYQDSLALDPDDPYSYAFRGLAYYAMGDFQRARASCESKPDNRFSQQCLAMTYNKLGRHGDAEVVLAKMKTSLGETAAYQYAEIHAQWGNTSKALEWLDTALRLRDPGLADIKTDLLLDPLRQESRFQAIERALKFPT